MKNQIPNQENKIMYSKNYLVSILLIGFSLMSWSCDDRVPEETTSSSNANLTILATQAVSDIDPINVGEVVSGSSKLRLEAELMDENNVIIKDGVITFSCDQAGSFDVSSPTTDSEGKVYVIFDPNDGVEAVDKSSTVSTFEGATITATYNEKVTAEVEFNIYDTKDDVWPYNMNMSSNVSSILLDNGATTAQVEVQVFNKIYSAVEDVILSFSSSKGFLESEGTTDSSGTVNMIFRDTGTQNDIGLAYIYCTFTHPGFNATISDTISVTIGSDRNLVLDTTPISYLNGTTPIVVGEDIIGDVAITRIVASVLDTSGNGIAGQLVNLKATVLGANVGSLAITSNETDGEGQVYAYFDDGGNSYLDIAGTTEFDGVVITAYLGDSTSSTTTSNQVNVYPEDAWPYNLYLNSDVDQILLDNGATTAEIEARVENQYGAPIQNVTLYFESDKGTLEPTGVTDSAGVVTLTFSDNGTQDDLGLVNIEANFEHPGFASSITDSVQITIGTNNGMTLEIIPVSYDETGSTVIVGEDIAGNAAVMLLVATVVDTLQNPVAGTPVEFVTTSGNDEVGSISYDNNISNTEGQVIAYFDDGGTVYTDNPGTPNFEGVTVVASFGENTTDPESFNVYSEDNVWPYNLIINTDTDVIHVGGETVANITTRLLNALGNPVKNAQINYTSTLGFITATGYTDSTGIDTVAFTDLGDPDDVGVSDIVATFSHPGFSSVSIQDSLQIFIEDTTFQQCAYIEIPSSNPGRIVVRDGGGVESTLIKAEVYDDNGNLINTPTPVVFTLNPLVGDAYLNEVDSTTATAYTVNGVASVSVNSGTDPGPVRVEVTCDCDQDGTIDLTSVAVPVIIASGAPYYIEAEYDPQATETIGGGFYQTECAATVSDIHHNPVEDSTYVYWTIDPIAPDTLIDAFVEGVSFTNNEGIISGIATSGVARSVIVYSTDAIGDIGRVKAITFGANGDSVYTHINEDEGDATLFFLPGQVILMADATYWDFTFSADPATIMLTAIVNDFYGNAVVGAPVAFNGTGVSQWAEVGYEAYEDFGTDQEDGTNDLGEGDGCFTWRDYGADDDPTTTDWGNFNDEHDAIDTTGDGNWDVAEVSEAFDDFGVDGIDGTADEGEGDGEWNGYSMIGCDPIVHTDEDGYARIMVVYNKEICILANQDDETTPPTCTWDDFTSSLTATLMIPQITASDPLEVLLVRSPDTCD